ncbi:hypothetical protein ACRALDRAFT_2024610 [Sodiomyces alcalophilus JCM 7366]|uniref:uncharacterized protein n=1 Tax=Sodiomyces alcalophilus JCM 7366 TaxID=591952 RepID=UPI0039B57E87
MPSQYYNHPSSSFAQTRDSLELASLASSSHGPDTTFNYDDDDATPSSRPSLSSSRKLSFDNEDPFDEANPAASARNGARPPGRHARSFSVSSAFDFAPNLFPLSSTAGVAGYTPLGAPLSSTALHAAGGLGGGSLEKHKSLTFLNGLSLIIGLIIGSGIFSSPSQVSANVGSPGAALIVWVIAGLLAWTGAASYAELGGAIPLNGGSQVYLAKIMGELAGFLFTWVAVLVLKPGSAAIIAIIMGEYLVRAVYGADAAEINPWVNKSVALVGVALVTFLNCVSTRVGTKVNDLLMFLKFVALIAVTVTGVVVATTGYAFNGDPSTDWKTNDWFADTSTDLSAWAVALPTTSWGSSATPSRDLPRVIHTAMPLVIVSYVLANVAYFLVLPLATVYASNTIAVMFGAKVFGPVGSLVFALVVSASCFGALNSSTFTSSRLIYVAGKEGYIPSLFGRLGLRSSASHHASSTTTLSTHLPLQRSRGRAASLARRLLADPETGIFYTPIAALLLNAALTAAYIAVGEFATLITFYGVAGYTFYFLTVLGLIILRVKEPALERPYRTWITTPVIFCCVSIFLLSRAVFAQPFQTLTVILFVIAGVPVYFWRIRGRDQVVKRERPGGLPGGGDLGAGIDERKRPWWRFWRREG